MTSIPAGEQWRPVVGYEGCYEVSDAGRIRNQRRKGSILKPVKHENGYTFVMLSKNGAKKINSIHRIVAEAFIPNPENKPQVNHKNGIRNDNRLENLEWVTCSENAIHSFRVLGRKPNVAKGIPSPARKLTDEQVRAIRRDPRKAHVVGPEYGVDRKTVWSIRNGKTYCDVSGW